jgi:CheY-like chemotaxis protein
MKEPGGLSLLIVEDSAAVRQLIKSVVCNLAHTIYECADGVEAIADYSRFRPDFVLMDIRLTVMDGISATRQITRADPGAKIILVTDYDEMDLRESAKRAGAIGYVLKDNLLELVSFLKAQPRSEKNADRS